MANFLQSNSTAIAFADLGSAAADITLRQLLLLLAAVAVQPLRAFADAKSVATDRFGILRHFLAFLLLHESP